MVVNDEIDNGENVVKSTKVSMIGAGFELHGKFYWPRFTHSVNPIVFQGRRNRTSLKQVRTRKTRSFY